MNDFTMTEITNPILNVSASSQYTYGWVAGANNVTSFKGNLTDFIFAKGENEGSLGRGVVLNPSNPASAVPYLGYLAFTSGQPTWIGIPIASKGFRTFHASLQSSMNQDFDISAYLLPEISGDFNGGNIANRLLIQTLFTSEILSNGATLNFGPGGIDKQLYSPLPLGYLVIKVSPTTIPTDGVLRFGVERQK
ncbi:hypothetical protein [Niallia circulans]|uniref:hypothetical protein n=1 Tax=Niallia circulans TaxID=1397 RepID=UPI0026F33742|nr:hypothetical protein [Niallia circulans]